MVTAEAEPGALRGCLAVLSAFVAYLGNDVDGAAAYSREVLALLPEAWLFARSGGVLFQALAMQAGGQWQAAVRLLIESYESLGDRTSVYALRHLQGLCVVYYRQAGDLEQVVQIGRRLAEGAERSGLSLLHGWGYQCVGLAHYQRNELAAARQCFFEVLDLRYTANIGAVRDGVQRLALIHQIAGEPAEAWAMVEFLSQLDLDQMGREGDETRALRARLWLMRGELESAARWADDFATPVPEQAWPWHDPPHLIKARILLARGTAADVQLALELLAALGEVAQHSHNMRLLIEILALRALALDASGQAGDARDALLAAVELARPGGFVRPFLDLGAPMEEALDQLAEAGEPPQPPDGAPHPGRVWRPASRACAGRPGSGAPHAGFDGRSSRFGLGWLAAPDRTSKSPRARDPHVASGSRECQRDRPQTLHLISDCETPPEQHLRKARGRQALGCSDQG